jgi:hypothetical protein
VPKAFLFSKRQKKKTGYMKNSWKFTLLSIALLFCFVTPGYAADFTLDWDANTEPDLAGYKIYYKTGSSGPPYNGTDADQGPSPITVPIEDLYDPNNPEFTLTGLDDSEVYFFVVTAYDDEALESYYSNIAASDGSIGEYIGAGVGTKIRNSPDSP